MNHITSSFAAVLSNASRWHVEHGDSLAMLRALPDGCANLIWCDPPYFRVVDEAWDRAWRTEAAYFAWLRGVIAELARVLAPNGSLYLFAASSMSARVEVMASDFVRVLNSLVWNKAQADLPPGDPRAAAIRVRDVSQARAWVSFSERVVFAEPLHVPPGPFARAIGAARQRSGMSPLDLAVKIGRVRSKAATRSTGLVELWERGVCCPSACDFVKAMAACGDLRTAQELAVAHTSLRDLDSTERRPFNAPDSFTDVWTYAPPLPSSTRHPCEKPAAMCRDVVLASSRAGDVVLDPFGGSFVMAEATLNNGRRYIGCDADPHWAETGRARAVTACNGTVAAVAARKPDAKPARQRGLFDAHG